MNQDDYDELNKLIHDNYTSETGLALKGEILPHRTEAGFTLPQQHLPGLDEIACLEAVEICAGYDF